LHLNVARIAGNFLCSGSPTKLAWCHDASFPSFLRWCRAGQLDRLFQNIRHSREKSMITRAAKLMLLAGIALYYTLVVFNNLTDFDSNYQFVRHVLSMDTTFLGNHGMWRALPAPTFHLAFYISIIGWEITTTILLWWGAARLLRAMRLPASAFNAAKRVPVMALTLSLLMWLVAFLSIGAEWFLMWQSHAWTGEEAAFRMFTVVGLVLLIVLQPDVEGQP
jgi:predicted small integral membrane protein